jgi:hypothetical protein
MGFVTTGDILMLFEPFEISRYFVMRFGDFEIIMRCPCEILLLFAAYLIHAISP